MAKESTDETAKRRHGRPTLNLPRTNRTIVLQLDDPVQKHIDDEIQKMVNMGKWQRWIRERLEELLPMPAVVKVPRARPNGAHDEVYNETAREEA